MKPGIAEDWGIITDSKEKADLLFLILESVHFDSIVSRTMEEESGFRMTDWADGDRLVWLHPHEALGRRFDRLWIDKDIDEGIINDVILPTYSGDSNDIIWI